ncbi:phage baseplate assembly protein domain-containing protein [Metapseudomonas furukawaii]|uniref:phage baseplate assembly protein domain-containing protein n=1 Tax=Metapseudomonas furukawaii TaxID=1149133 RepID=UPI0040455AB8
MATLPRLVREQINRTLRNVRLALRGVLRRSETSWPNIGLEVEGLAGEQVATELIQHYGFTSAPLPGAEMIVLPIGGRTNHSVVVATEDGRYRIQIVEGEVSLYTDEGDYIHLKRGRLVEVNTVDLLINAANSVEINTTDYRLNARASAHIATTLYDLAASASVTTTTQVSLLTAKASASVVTPSLTATVATGLVVTAPLVEVIAATRLGLTAPAMALTAPLGFQLESPITTVKANMWYELDTPLNYQNPKMQQKPTPAPLNPAATKP